MLHHEIFVASDFFCREPAIASEHGSVAVPDPGSGAFLTPGSGMGERSGSGSRMNNPDHISESLETIFGDPGCEKFGSGMENSDPGWKKFGSGINILDPQHCSRV